MVEQIRIIMKAEFLKIAKVKDEKSFYKKYPTEAAFFKAHPEAKKSIKKAQIGAYIGGDTNANAQLVNYGDAYDSVEKSLLGSTDSERQEAAYKQAMLDALKSKGGKEGGQSSGMDMGSIMKMIGGGGDGEGGSGEMMEMLGGMKHGGNIPKAYSGTNVNNWWSNLTTTAQSTYPPNVSQTYGIGAQTMGKIGGGSAPANQPGTQGSYGFGGTNYTGPQGAYSRIPNGDPNGPGGIMGKNTSGAPYATGNVTQSNDYQMGPAGEESGGNFSKGLESATKAIPIVGGIVSGINALEAEKQAAARAKQLRMLTDLQLTASRTRPEQKERKYVRPEDVVNTGEAFFPVYGVGTNVLARDGVKLQGGGRIGGNPTEIQNTYGDGHSIYDDLGYVPLIDEDQDKNFRYGGDIPRASTGWQNYMNTMNGGGSGFSGAGAAGGTPWGAIGGAASNLAQQFGTGPNAGGDLGGNIGQSVGAAFGPIGMAAGQVVGTIAGKLLDKYPGQIKRDTAKTKTNVENIAYNQIAPSIQAGYASHVRDGGSIPNYEDGGYMNPEYNPQVITMFGDHNAQDFADYAKKDQYRAGGHLKSYTPPSDRAMEEYAMGGEIQTTWGGHAETMSHNPYLPGTGETVMFRGQSHDESDGKGNTGIGVKYGKPDSYTDYAEEGAMADADVEVERNEPATELMDPNTKEKNLVVFGNLRIPDRYVDLLGDPKAKGMKFKNYIAKKSKEEDKINKMIDKSTDQLNALDVETSGDRLTLASLEAKIKGGNMKLKEIADIKITSAGIQNAYNETAEEQGLVADDLAKGKFKIDKEAMQTKDARFGDVISKAKDGKTTTKETTTVPKKLEQYTSVEALKADGFKQNAKGEWYKTVEGKKKTSTEKKSASAMDNIPKQSVDQKTGLFGGVTPEQFKAYKDKNSWYDWSGFDPTDQEDVDKYAKAFNAESEKRGSKARILPDVEIDPKTKKPIPGTKTKYVGKQVVSANLEDVKEEAPGEEAQEYAVLREPGNTPVPYKRSGLLDFANQALDYLRPTDQEPFDYGQAMSEMYALSNNQVEPVQAQMYKPELRIPYDISYQDVLDENQADFNATIKQLGYNPAAQPMVNANKYMANQRVLGDQFRANQAMKDQVYSGNVNTLNQAKITNLGILDKQYERQSQALSNTKATTQAALSSLDDKIAKNKLENKTLGIYENLYKYRYDKNGRAINMNGIFQPNIPTVGSTTGTQKQVPIYKADGKTIDHYQLEEMTPQEIIEAQQKEQQQYAAVPSLATLPINGNLQGKNKKTSRNGSIVKAIKNL